LEGSDTDHIGRLKTFNTLFGDEANAFGCFSILMFDEEKAVISLTGKKIGQFVTKYGEVNNK
jgi:hypothetical protein